MKRLTSTLCAAVMAMTGVAEAPAAVLGPDAAMIKLKSTGSDVIRIWDRRGFYGGGYYRRGFYRGGGYYGRGIYPGGYYRRGFYGGGYYGRGFYGGGGYYGNYYGLWAPGAAFIAGAIIGSALARPWGPAYGPPYRAYRRPYAVYPRPYVVYRRPYAVYDYTYQRCTSWRQAC